MQKHEIAEWVATTLAKAKISYAKASRALGLPADAISKVVRGSRNLSAAEMAQIAEMAGETVPELTLVTGSQPRYVKVRGEVAAGLWRDVHAQDYAESDFVALVDARWPPEAVFGLVVKGESINKKAQDGDRVVALHHEYAPRDLRNGDWVIVERTRNDLCERTVKQARWADGDGWELWPSSHDPRYQQPVVLGEHETESVRVVAYVLDFVSTATQF